MPRFLKYPFAVFLVLATLLCALGAAPAQAAALVVNGNTDYTLANLAGNGTCDLREAIEAANTDAVVGECRATKPGEHAF